MEDTSSENRRIVRDIVEAMSVERRFLACAGMYEEAKEFAKVGMPKGLSAEEEAEFVFKRIHGSLPKEIIGSGTVDNR